MTETTACMCCSHTHLPWWAVLLIVVAAVAFGLALTALADRYPPGGRR